MKRYIKKNITALIMIALFLLAGTFFIVFAPGRFFLVFSYFLAAYLLIAAVVLICLFPREKQPHNILFSKSLLIPEGILLICLGILTVAFPAVVLLIDIILVMLISPTIAIAASRERRKAIKQNLWKYIAGITLVVIVIFAFLHNIFLIIIGIAFYIGAGFLVYLLIVNAGPGEKPSLFDKYLVKYIVMLCGSKE